MSSEYRTPFGEASTISRAFFRIVSLRVGGIRALLSERFY